MLLPALGKPDQGDVGHELELEAEPALLAHLALLGEGRGPPPVGEEAGVAPPAPPARGRQPPVAVAARGRPAPCRRWSLHDRALGHRRPRGRRPGRRGAPSPLPWAPLLGPPVGVVAEARAARPRCGRRPARRRRPCRRRRRRARPWATWASRRNDTAPAPPSPALTWRPLSSTKPATPERLRGRTCLPAAGSWPGTARRQASGWRGPGRWVPARRRSPSVASSSLGASVGAGASFASSLAQPDRGWLGRHRHRRRRAGGRRRSTLGHLPRRGPIRSDGLGYHVWTRLMLDGSVDACAYPELGQSLFTVPASSSDPDGLRCIDKYPVGLAILRLPVMAPLVEQPRGDPLVTDDEHRAAYACALAALVATSAVVLRTAWRLRIRPSGPTSLCSPSPSAPDCSSSARTTPVSPTSSRRCSSPCSSTASSGASTGPGRGRSCSSWASAASSWCRSAATPGCSCWPASSAPSSWPSGGTEACAAGSSPAGASPRHGRPSSARRSPVPSSSA